MIGIIDYGMGNLASVQNALTYLDAEHRLIKNPDALKDCDKLILPGVGAFGDCMKNIHQAHMYDEIVRLVHEGKPLLGICLGMQVLFESSEEKGTTEGFGFLKGKVCRMYGENLRIPQIGWNRLEIENDHPIMHTSNTAPYVYFVHSYYATNYDPNDLIGYAMYGKIKVPGLVYHKNVLGSQYHPEKSGKYGLSQLKYFVEEFV